jgi:hypothetical protein
MGLKEAKRKLQHIDSDQKPKKKKKWDKVT